MRRETRPRQPPVARRRASPRRHRIPSLRSLYLGFWEFPDTAGLPRSPAVFPHLREIGLFRTITCAMSSRHYRARLPITSLYHGPEWLRHQAKVLGYLEPSTHQLVIGGTVIEIEISSYVSYFMGDYIAQISIYAICIFSWAVCLNFKSMALCS
jgi:hypothetical protein